MMDPATAATPATPLRVPPSPFLKRLGYGAGVSVYEMARSPRVGVARSPWAIKRLVPQHENDPARKTVYGRRLLAEADLLRKMSHPNVVGFRSQRGECLAMERCETCLGSMIEDRRERADSPYEPHQILKMALDVSAALDYLHRTVLILHGDVKSFNVLVNGDFAACKLCDFGVSLPLKENGDLAVDRDAYIGTGCWVAPEALDDDRPITSKTDIFSFGLTVWEMMSLEIPHTVFDQTADIDPDANTSDSISEDKFEDSCAAFGTRPGLPDIDETEYEDVLTLFYCTTEDDPKERLSAEHINQYVKEILKIPK